MSGGGSRACPGVEPGGRSGLALGGGAASWAGRLQRCAVRTRCPPGPPAPPAWHVPRRRVLAFPHASACVAAAAWRSPLLRLSVSRACPDSLGLLVPVRASNLLRLEGVAHVWTSRATQCLVRRLRTSRRAGVAGRVASPRGWARGRPGSGRRARPRGSRRALGSGPGPHLPRVADAARPEPARDTLCLIAHASASPFFWMLHEVESSCLLGCVVFLS